MGVARNVFVAVSGFDEGLRCLQDSDLCWRIQLAGTPLTYHREVLLHTRLRNSLTGMARQGYLYGRSCAQLESRYHGTGDPRATTVHNARVRAASTQPRPARRFGPVGKLLGVLRDGGPGRTPAASTPTGVFHRPLGGLHPLQG